MKVCAEDADQVDVLSALHSAALLSVSYEYPRPL